MIVDIQVSAATNPWPVLRDATLAAEHAGYGAALVYDHLAGATLGGSTVLEPLALLGALAVATTRIELGTSVINLGLRSPAAVASAASSVATISGRHVHLGVGAGPSPSSRFAAELDAVGHPIPSSIAARHAVVEQAFDIFDAVWSPDRPDELGTFPSPDLRPTIVVGLHSRDLAELAGRRADGVNVPWSSARRDELIDVARGARPNDSSFVVTTWTRWAPELLDPEHPDRRTMDATGIDRLVLAVLDRADVDRIARHCVM